MSTPADAGSPSAGAKTCTCPTGLSGHWAHCPGATPPAVPSPEDTVEASWLLRISEADQVLTVAQIPPGRWELYRVNEHTVDWRYIVGEPTPPAVRTGEDDGAEELPSCMTGHASAPVCSRCGFDRRCYDARRAWRTTTTTVAEDRAYETGWRAALSARPLVSGTANRDDRLLDARVALDVALDQRDTDAIADAATELLTLLNEEPR